MRNYISCEQAFAVVILHGIFLRQREREREKVLPVPHGFNWTALISVLLALCCWAPAEAVRPRIQDWRIAQYVFLLPSFHWSSLITFRQ